VVFCHLDAVSQAYDNPDGKVLVYDGRRLLFANLQDLKEAIKNKWKEVSIETVH